MGQIISLAKSFGADTGGETGGDTDGEKTTDSTQTQTQSPPTDTFDISALDPKLIQTALHLFQEYNRSDDRNLALLTALRPFLKEERLEKMDQAIQIAKLSRVAKMAFQLLKGGEEGV